MNSAVAAGSLITSPVTAAGQPGRLQGRPRTPRRRSPSPRGRGCRPGPARGRRSGAPPRRVDRHADGREQPVGHAEDRSAAEDPGEADHGCRAAISACPDPGDTEDRPDGHHRVAGRDQDQVRRRRRPRADAGAGRASAIPTCSTASASGSACRRTQYSWKCTCVQPCAGSGTVTWVSTRSSLIGRSASRGSGIQRAHSAGGHLATGSARRPATGCGTGGWPRRCRRDRTRVRRRTRSGRRGSASSPPTRPQPRSGSMPPPREYIIVSRSGQIRSPYIVMSSAVLTTTVSSASG